jgi:dihydropteroate synthase
MSSVTRPHFSWRLRTRTLSLGERTGIMGILNVTPDSFSDGGQFLDSHLAVDHALEMLDQGADLLDLGGESTRPNSIPMVAAEEQSRVLPVLKKILAARPDAIVSIDTYHSETARLAIDAGAEIVNDVSGHLWDEGMSATCAALGCGAILMHTRGRPQEWRGLPALKADEVIPLVRSDLAARCEAVLAAGVARESIVLDPGFGFGKAFDENYPLLSNFGDLHALGFPLLAGVSRKSFLTRALRSAQRVEANELPTAVGNTAAILAGAHILRVHDVRAGRDTALIADRIRQASTS